MPKPFRFPVPAAPLRRLLDARAASGEVWFEDEAVIDIMLALDRGDVKPVRYYAKRWSWSKSKVAREIERLKSEAESWRVFDSPEEPTNPPNEDSPRHLGQPWDNRGTTVGQDSLNPGDMGVFWDTGGTAVGQPWDSIEQNSRTPEASAQTRARAHEGPAGEGDSSVTGPSTIEELPPDHQRYSAEIAAIRTEADRGGLASAALRTSLTPPRPILDAIAEGAARAGPLGVIAALVVTRYECDSRAPTTRLKFFRAVVRTIAEHHDRLQHQTQDSQAAQGGPARSEPRGDRRSDRRSGDRRDGDRRNARERANQLTVADLAASGERSLELLRALEAGDRLQADDAYEGGHED